MKLRQTGKSLPVTKNLKLMERRIMLLKVKKKMKEARKMMKKKAMERIARAKMPMTILQ
jgi:hypothetical protein